MFKEKVCHIGRIIMILSLIFTVSSEFGHAQINDPPEIMNLAADFVMYTQGDGAVLLDAGSDAFAIDVDSPDFDGGRLEAQIIAGFGQFEDVLTERSPPFFRTLRSFRNFGFPQISPKQFLFYRSEKNCLMTHFVSDKMSHDTILKSYSFSVPLFKINFKSLILMNIT